MYIDWYRVSEIVFEATLGGIISGVVVWIAYHLGKMQSNNDWRRRIEYEQTQERISALREVIGIHGALQSADHLGWGEIDQTELRRVIFRASTLFSEDDIIDNMFYIYNAIGQKDWRDETLDYFAELRKALIDLEDQFGN